MTTQQKFLRKVLRKEIIVILVVKFLFMFTLWIVFFSDPIADHLTSTDVSSHIMHDKS